MKSAEIRQSFIDFFRSKKHTIVRSSSLMPDSPNLLFTNAGMNQFVPIFLGERKPDVSRWADAVPGLDTRAADTQKCIRAGGKHNDLDDVGLDTYHHTFFEMLGNWSFGDYFKKEAIGWSWELIVERFQFPPNRVYATIYQPDPGDPSERDQEAYDLWAEKFRSVGLDPDVHIVNGNKKDNFWMMGETGPCGPCSEIHIDLTPAGDTKGALVNKGVPECIEIWNNVFIQFNANPDGTFTPLPAQHVDTGMGFERLTSIIQGTKSFTDFANARISNYETDIFRPIFDEIEKLSGKQYGSTLPKAGSTGETEQEKVDVAFRVIADHIRTLSFAVADGIQPGNTDRNYVLRRILRRAVRYGRTLGFKEPFFYKLVAVLAETMGDVFPEIRAKQKHVEETLKREEESFNKTLDTGIEIFDEMVSGAAMKIPGERAATAEVVDGQMKVQVEVEPEDRSLMAGAIIPGYDAFRLYDTYGFPLDLTELMARERGLTVDIAGFEVEMEKQRTRARAAQKKQVIELSEVETKEPTHFLGYDLSQSSEEAIVLEVVGFKDKTAVILDQTTFYAEMGGQVGDTGQLLYPDEAFDRPSEEGEEVEVDGLDIVNTQKVGHTWLHFVAPKEGERLPEVGERVLALVDSHRRAGIQRHHTVTHLLHWALHEVVSKDATQKGSFVGPEKLTFDFNGAALTPGQVRDIERLVNEGIVDNAAVSWIEVPYTEVRGREDVMQFFGDKYGETVRVVQIGGDSHRLDGYSMELCAGTHTRATGEIGLFRIASEAAIAAGVRRIEAQAGLNAYELATADTLRLHALATKLGTPLPELEKRVEGLLAQHKELEKALASARHREAAITAKRLLETAESLGNIRAIIADLGDSDGDVLQAIADGMKGGFEGVIFLAGHRDGNVALVASVTAPALTSKIQAGKLIQTVAPIVGGKGGGRPDNARGGGKDPAKIGEALKAAREYVAGQSV